jgi:hypothetical protein
VKVDELYNPGAEPWITLHGFVPLPVTFNTVVPSPLVGTLYVPESVSVQIPLSFEAVTVPPVMLPLPSAVNVPIMFDCSAGRPIANAYVPVTLAFEYPDWAWTTGMILLLDDVPAEHAMSVNNNADVAQLRNRFLIGPRDCWMMSHQRLLYFSSEYMGVPTPGRTYKGVVRIIKDN